MHGSIISLKSIYQRVNSRRRVQGQSQEFLDRLASSLLPKHNQDREPQGIETENNNGRIAQEIENVVSEESLLPGAVNTQSRVVRGMTIGTDFDVKTLFSCTATFPEVYAVIPLSFL